jgi:hypothetical protein
MSILYSAPSTVNGKVESFQEVTTRMLLCRFNEFTSNPPHGQIIYSWCNEPNPMLVDCTDCYWVVNDSGFFVADSDVSPLKFVTGWAY